MLEFCSRYTFGVIIGSTYILCSIIYFLVTLYYFINYNNNNVTDVERIKLLKSEDIRSMISSLVTVLMSVIFILAIVKREHYLIIPWLIFCIYGFYVSGKFLYWAFIGAGMGNASRNTFLVLLLISILVMGVQIAIFYFSISLYKEIYNENN